MRDHHLLRIEHFGELHRPARFHLVADAVGGAARHAAQEAAADGLLDALQRLVSIRRRRCGSAFRGSCRRARADCRRRTSPLRSPWRLRVDLDELGHDPLLGRLAGARQDLGRFARAAELQAVDCGRCRRDWRASLFSVSIASGGTGPSLATRRRICGCAASGRSRTPGGDLGIELGEQHRGDLRMLLLDHRGDLLGSNQSSSSSRRAASTGVIRASTPSAFPARARDSSSPSTCGRGSKPTRSGRAP